MTPFRPDDSIPPRILASDLDGTLIPLEGNSDNRQALEAIDAAAGDKKGRVLLFATGRNYESVLEAMEQDALPTPEWIICDVGTSIYQAGSGAGGFLAFQPYQDHLDARTGHIDRQAVQEALAGVHGLELQRPENQRRFKISYLCREADVPEMEARANHLCSERNLPFVALGSVDPFSHKGLLDLLPTGVNKAYAVQWLATHADFQPDEVVYAGDSGNDHAALVCGFRAIVVENMRPDLKARISREMEANGWSHRLYIAGEKATSGVLEGCRHFGWM